MRQQIGPYVAGMVDERIGDGKRRIEVSIIAHEHVRQGLEHGVTVGTAQHRKDHGYAERCQSQAEYKGRKLSTVHASLVGIKCAEESIELIRTAGFTKDSHG